MKKLFLGFSLTLLFLMLFSIVLLANETYETKYYEVKIPIENPDGFLKANVTMPDVDSDEKFPVIIFSHGWIADNKQFIEQANMFAQYGYIVLRYDVRGWHGSDGEIDMFGPKTTGDFSPIIDYLLENTPVLQIDGQYMIGVAGVSQGGIVSFIGAACEKENRIKAVVMLSAGMDMTRALYAGKTTKWAWITVLNLSAQWLGKLSDEVNQVFNNLMNHENIEDTVDFLYSRSAKNYIEKINERNIPVFMSFNMQDSLFWPEHGFDYYSSITSPAYMIFNKGNHATTEFEETTKDFIWDNVVSFFDHFLKGLNNDITENSKVNIYLEPDNERFIFNEWPPVKDGVSQVEEKKYYLQPQKFFSYGKISENPVESLTKNVIGSWTAAGFSNIIARPPAHKEDVRIPLWQINRFAAAVYTSDEYVNDQIICGAPSLDLTIEHTLSEAQIVVHLYDVDQDGVGTLISYAPLSLYDVEPNSPVRVSVKLSGTGYRIKKGHKLGVAIDTGDFYYLSHAKSKFYINFLYSNPPELSIPFLNIDSESESLPVKFFQ